MQAQLEPILTSSSVPQQQSSEVIARVSKYRDVLQTAAVIVREEGIGALYKGLAPTVLRQGCNQVTRDVLATKLEGFRARRRGRGYGRS